MSQTALQPAPTCIQTTPLPADWHGTRISADSALVGREVQRSETLGLGACAQIRKNMRQTVVKDDRGNAKPSVETAYHIFVPVPHGTGWAWDHSGPFPTMAQARAEWPALFPAPPTPAPKPTAPKSAYAKTGQAKR